jgi:alkanesulfonate monooxygenase SsuD/methylene tetrahydromethanopterin reductase-like flavin-dependent oxidoreductase (luciferase family)
MDTPVVLLHGFTDEQALAVMRAAKQAAAGAGRDPASIAFAMTTTTNVEWQVKELLAEVAEEHEYMKQNGPGAAPAQG